MLAAIISLVITACTAQCNYTPNDVEVLRGDEVVISLPPARSCLNALEPLPCIRSYIDDMDIQLSFLLARRLQFAGVAGTVKYAQGKPLDDPKRDEAVKRQISRAIKGFGGDEDIGEKFAKFLLKQTLEYEESIIAETCSVMPGQSP